MKEKKKLICWLLALVMLLSVGINPVNTEAAAPKLTKKSITVGAGQSKTLQVKNYNKKVKWKTSNKKIATVSSKGKVTGKKPGTVKITATAGKKKLTCKVKVVIALNKTSLVMNPGQKKVLKVNGTKKKAKWSSSKKSVVKVTSSGTIKALKTGTATITAKVGKKKLKCKVTVVTNNKKKTVNNTYTITFTNKDKQTIPMSSGKETCERLVTTDDQITVTGKITGKTTKSGTYSVTDENGSNVCSGTINQADGFSFVVPLTKGSYIVTVNAVSTSGDKASKQLYIVKDTKTLTHSETVKEGSSEDTEDLIKNIISFKTTTDTDGTEHRILTISKKSDLYEKYSDGEYRIGDVIELPASEDLPTGFSGEIEKVANGSDSGQAVITMKEPDISEMYEEEGSVSTNGIYTKDPIAFIYMGDGTNALSSQNLSTLAESDDYSRSVLPAGISKSNFKIDASVTQDGGNISLNLDDLILYDKDKKKSTKDQLTLSGSIGIKDLLVEEHYDWDNWSFNQYYFNQHYTEESNLTLSTTLGKQSLSDFQKYWTGEWDNKSNTSLFGFKNVGVDMSKRCPLCFIGIRLNCPVDVKWGTEIGDYASKNELPVAIIAVYMNMDGSVSVDGTMKIEYSAYHTNGINVAKTSLKNPVYGRGETYTNTDEVGKYTVKSFKDTRKSATDHSKAEHKVTLTMQGQATLSTGLGVFGGIMMDGVIPADIYGELDADTTGTIMGQLSWTPQSTNKDYLKLNVEADLDVTSNVKAGLRAHFSIESEDSKKTTLPVNIDSSLEKTWELLNYHFQLPYPDITGTIFGYPEATSAKPTALSGALVYLYSEDNTAIQNDPAYQGASDKSTYLPTESRLKNREEDYVAETKSGGGYEIKYIPQGVYYLEVVKDGYVTTIERIDLQKDTTKDYTLKHTRDVNWLDVCKPYDFNSSLCKNLMGDSSEHLTVSGIDYYVGFKLYADGGTASFNLDGKYEKLDVRIGHVDSSWRTEGQLQVYLDGAEEPNQTIDLGVKKASEVYTIDLNYASSAVFKVVRYGGGYVNWSKPAYAFVEGVWYGKTAVEGTLHPYNQYDDMDTDGKNFMDICAPFGGESCATFNNTEGKSFSVGGVKQTVGFTISSQSVPSTFLGNYVVFFTRGQMNTLTLKVGKASGYNCNPEMYVYLDGVQDDSQTQVLKYSVASQTVTINVKGANSLAIQMQNKHDNWSTVTYGFYDGIWN